MTVEADIKHVYERYRRALLAGDGHAAVDAVDKESIEQFERLRTDALYLESAKVRLLPVVEALVVLLVRLRYTPGELRALDGPGLLAQAVSKGWIGKEGAMRIELGATHVAGDDAAARVIHEGQPTAMRLRFVYEDEAWKLRLNEMMAMAEQSMVMMGTQSGLSAVETVEAMLKRQAPEVDPGMLWEPPVQGP